MTPPAAPLKARLARILPYFANSRRGFVIGFGGAVVAAATEPAIPLLIKWLVDSGFQLGRVPLWAVPTAIIGLTLIRGLAGFVAQYGMSWAASRGILELRRAMFARLLDAEPALFVKTASSSLVHTLTSEVQVGTNQLINALQTLVRDSLMLVAMVGVLLWLNWRLTIVVAVLLPAVALVVRYYSRRLRRYTVESRRAVDGLGYVVEENVLAWRSVRLHDAGPAQAGRFTAVSEKLRRLNLKAVIASATMTPLTQLLASCALAAVFTAALWQSSRDQATIGGFIAFITALMQLIAPIKHLAEVTQPLTRGMVALDHGIDLIELNRPEQGGSHDPGRAVGRVEFRDVSLVYRDGLPPALDRVSILIEPGESVALVGPSGAGKTTVVNLLPRFIEPTTGEILLDGVPLREWEPKALRRQMALVGQDVSLFNDTIAANVALGAAIDMAKVREALRAAHLLTFAEGLPQGLETVVGHNANEFSGGQRQRLAIARAIYRDAPILILDEATSALDSESERLVQQALEALMRGRTSLVVAHRFSTIERAGRIVALDHGRIVEQGSHADLIAPGPKGQGLYARLHALQNRNAA